MIKRSLFSHKYGPSKDSQSSMGNSPSIVKYVKKKFFQNSSMPLYPSSYVQLRLMRRKGTVKTIRERISRTRKKLMSQSVSSSSRMNKAVALNSLSQSNALAKSHKLAKAAMTRINSMCSERKLMLIVTKIEHKRLNKSNMFHKFKYSEQCPTPLNYNTSRQMLYAIVR